MIPCFDHWADYYLYFLGGAWGLSGILTICIILMALTMRVEICNSRQCVFINVCMF